MNTYPAPTAEAAREWAMKREALHRLPTARALAEALPRGLCPGCGLPAPYPLDVYANPGYCSPECANQHPDAWECDCGPGLAVYGVCPVVLPRSASRARCAKPADHSALFARGPVMPPGGWVAVCADCAHSNPTFLAAKPRRAE